MSELGDRMRAAYGATQPISRVGGVFPCVRVYEDNAGSVYLCRGADVWALGPVTPDMEGNARRDALAWSLGGWEPSEESGQSRVEGAHDLMLIGMCLPTGRLVPERDIWGNSVAGAGGRAYLGPHPAHDPLSRMV
jgi:hypothetical protein